MNDQEALYVPSLAANAKRSSRHHAVWRLRNNLCGSELWRMASLSWTITGIALSLALPVQASSQEWQQFGVLQSGFVFDVPPGFLLTQRAENGQGATFEEKGGASLVVWGEDLATGDFRARIGDQIAAGERNGWHLTYRRLTPRWSSYSGIKGDKIRYFRAVAICANRMAAFKLDYSRDQKVPYDPVVVRMVRSLKAEGC
jgi:hypothetical protein